MNRTNKLKVDTKPRPHEWTEAESKEALENPDFFA